MNSTGALVRGQIAFKSLISLQTDQERALAVAVAIEYFQTASLLLDDLPCMDDAMYRRGELCAHKVYGEASTILASLALINRSYSLLWSSWDVLGLAQRKRAADAVEQCLGVEGILQGQALDLNFTPNSSPADIISVARKKTGSLIRLSLILPAIMTATSAKELRLLEALAETWTLTYQAIDDLNDITADTFEAGKTTERDQALNRPNIALALGVEETKDRIERLSTVCRSLIGKLERCSLHWSFLRNLASYLDQASLGQKKVLLAS